MRDVRSIFELLSSNSRSEIQKSAKDSDDDDDEAKRTKQKNNKYLCESIWSVSTQSISLLSFSLRPNKNVHFSSFDLHSNEFRITTQMIRSSSNLSHKQTADSENHFMLHGVRHCFRAYFKCRSTSIRFAKNQTAVVQCPTASNYQTYSLFKSIGHYRASKQVSTAHQTSKRRRNFSIFNSIQY